MSEIKVKKIILIWENFQNRKYNYSKRTKIGKRIIILAEYSPT